MAVTGKLYGKLMLSLWAKQIDWLNDTIKAQLHTSAYTPDQDAHQYKSDLTNEVAATGGYATGGVTLTTKTITYTAGTNIAMLDADDAVWSSSTITARLAVILDITPATDATRPLIAYQTESADLSSSGGEWRAQWNASGIAQFTVS